MGTPRDYGRQYRKPLAGPLQIRIGTSTQRGVVTRFMIQLEYRLDCEWRQVVRYDHDADAPPEMAHDVTEDGLHVDRYRDGEKVDTVQLSGPMSANTAFTQAEEHLTDNLETIIRRFERWHGIQSR